MDKTNENTPGVGSPTSGGSTERGAGPGNPNALRHGFYATGFTEEEIAGWMKRLPRNSAGRNQLDEGVDPAGVQHAG